MYRFVDVDITSDGLTISYSHFPFGPTSVEVWNQTNAPSCP